jgi:hypothetical protein
MMLFSRRGKNDYERGDRNSFQTKKTILTPGEFLKNPSFDGPLLYCVIS